jgi:hypothetical protein
MSEAVAIVILSQIPVAGLIWLARHAVAATLRGDKASGRVITPPANRTRQNASYWN